MASQETFNTVFKYTTLSTQMKQFLQENENKPVKMVTYRFLVVFVTVTVGKY